MAKEKQTPTLKCRTAWLSDIHLGYQGCKTEFLLDFLDKVECDYLYLVGDILDVQHMQEKGFYWPDSHNDVVEALFKKTKNNTKVFYIPGNHDEIFRQYDGLTFHNVEIHNRCIHQTIDGRRLLMMHGDEFDSVLNHHPIIRSLGDISNDFILFINRSLHKLHHTVGLPYFSYSGLIKRKIKHLIQHTSTIQKAVVEEAKKSAVDGIVCGHQHQAQIKNMNGILYCNDGDWVENCTTMVEHEDGTLELLRWREKVTSLSTCRPLHASAPNGGVANTIT